jgi:hypothetical protein
MTAASDARDGMRGPGDAWGGYGWRSYRCGMAMGWRPVELLAMILGFIVFWPIGLAVLAWKVWQKKSAYPGDFAAFAEQKWRAATSGFSRAGRPERWRPFATGNAAFDDWKSAEIARLEEERRRLEEAQREFAAFLHNLRYARDREEFERFMAERRAAQARGAGDPQGPNPA